MAPDAAAMNCMCCSFTLSITRRRRDGSSAAEAGMRHVASMMLISDYKFSALTPFSINQL